MCSRTGGVRDGRRLRTVRGVERGVRALLPALNGWENVALPLLLTGVSVATARVLAMAALDDVALAGSADALPEERSRADRRSAWRWRALVIRPPLILADEPTGQLDRANADRVLDLPLDATDSALVVCTHRCRVARRRTRYGSSGPPRCRRGRAWAVNGGSNLPGPHH